MEAFMLLPLLSLLCPLLLAGAAYGQSAGRATRPPAVEMAALGALAVAAVSVVAVILGFGGTSVLLGFAGVGLSVRLDAVSATMLLLVAFIGWVVLRFSLTYTLGEPRREVFLRRICLTLAAVMLLVTAGNLVQLAVAWILLGLSVRQCLLFYPDRVPAQRAARKKLISSAISSLALIAAVILLARGYGTTDIATILAAARDGVAPAALPWAAGLIAVAALLKSAQVPAHGWLTEVMEAPTPVSALLHAGVVNAGGFLLIRFADVMLLAPGALAALVMVGGFSALSAGS
jgi:NAD(P)H-quinone oxidoreductase subunit 5